MRPKVWTIPKVQIEENILAEVEVPAARAQRLIERLDRRERQRRPPGADEQRRNRDVKAIHHAGLHEARHGDAPSLDQHPSITGIP